MSHKIYFRADATTQMGYGHFVRTLALADMLKDDFDCTFFTVTPTEYQIGEMKNVCPYIALEEPTKLDYFLDCLTGDETVVLDNYFYTSHYHKQIKEKGCRLVCIDDTHDTHYVADIVINHATGLNRSLFDVEPYTELCTGLNWSLLRNEFLQSFTRKQRTLKDVFVCLGGADAKNITQKAIAAALQLKDENTRGFKNKEDVAATMQPTADFNVQVVLGDGYPFWEKIQETYRNSPSVVFHKNLTARQMVDLMSKCRIGFVSASGLLWETQQVGLPVIYGYYTTNQMDICRNNRTIGHSICADNYETSSIDRLSALMQQLYALDVEKIQTHADTVSSNYKALFKSRVTSRRASLSDCDQYFQWANDPAIRQMSHNKAPIRYEDHVAWFKKNIQQNNNYLYIYYYKGIPVGQVRYNVEEEGVEEDEGRGAKGKAKRKATIDIALDKHFRGMNLGYEILTKSILDFRLECPDARITSEVLAENTASQHTFEKCGFTLMNQSDTIFYYELHHTL